MVKNLRLSGETLAKIFTNKITSWDDPAITADNNGRSFPNKKIVPVVRSDGSGTTAQFTTWLDKAYPSIWRPYFGRSGLTSYYPKKGDVMIAQSGSDQVMNTVSGFAGDGTIGYVEYSYPLDKGYPVVKVLNKGGYYVEPTQYNTAVALTKARIETKDKNPAKYLTQILDDVYTNPDPRAYPISSYSYMIIPTGSDDPRMTTAKRQSIADFLFYSLCAGQTKAGPFGYSPLPVNLVTAGFQQIAQLKKADAKVNLTNRDVRSCNNPTFDGKNPSRNLLAEIAPQPASCDKQGEGPCGTETGTGKPSTDGDDPAAGTADPGAAGAGAGATGGADPGGAAGPPGGAPAAGGPPGSSSAGSSAVAGTADEAVYANSTTLDNRPPDSKTFGWVAAFLLLALVVLPGLVAARVRRRGGA
jgi:phosphate transport system substrate-binding protein